MMHRSIVLLLAGTSFVSTAVQAQAQNTGAPAPLATDQAAPVDAVANEDIIEIGRAHV